MPFRLSELLTIVGVRGQVHKTFKSSVTSFKKPRSLLVFPLGLCRRIKAQTETSRNNDHIKQLHQKFMKSNLSFFFPFLVVYEEPKDYFFFSFFSPIVNRIILRSDSKILIFFPRYLLSFILVVEENVCTVL